MSFRLTSALRRSTIRDVKSKTRRDGWRGQVFKGLRMARGRSREWVSTQTGVTAQSVAFYELDKTFPSHRWRDAAALALKLDRRLLGAGEG